MKVRMRAIVIYEWNEDSDDWDEDVDIETKEELIEMVRVYCKDDPSYIFETEAKSIEIEEVNSVDTADTI